MSAGTWQSFFVLRLGGVQGCYVSESGLTTVLDRAARYQSTTLAERSRSNSLLEGVNNAEVVPARVDAEGKVRLEVAEVAHTRGPWKVDAGFSACGAAAFDIHAPIPGHPPAVGYWIATVYTHQLPVDRVDEARVNAALIAAAPEMLAMPEDVVVIFKSERLHGTAKVVGELIEKAKGGRK